MPHDHDHKEGQTPAPGTRCELCGMLAVAAIKDENGVGHNFCEHHIPITNAGALQSHGDHGEDHHKAEAHKDRHYHAGHSVNMFRDRFWVSLILTLPILYYSELFQKYLSYQAIAFPGSEWLSTILGTAIFFYGGIVFLRSAWGELRARQPGMMTLIALAITVAYVYSLATTFYIQGTEFFWELATLITIMLFGHWMEMRSVSQAQGALQELAKLLPDVAERIVGSARNAEDAGQIETVPLDQIDVGDILLVRPGAKIPADGLVVDGESQVDESMITGESRPVDKGEESPVIAGTVNGDGSLKIKVTKIGADTALSGIMRLVASAQASRSRAQMLADRAALYLTFVAISVGILTFIGWLWGAAGLNVALERTVTVLVIACPHALGLAIPLVTSISTSLAAKKGILVRDRLALEQAKNIEVVLFDKTGTLTEGRQAVANVVSIERGKAAEVLRLAAAVEAESEHHIAKSIVEEAHRRHIPIAVVKKFTALPGQGAKALLGQKTVEVVGPQVITRRGYKLPESLDKIIVHAENRGETTVFVVVDERVIGAITLADRVRKESREAVQALKKMGLEVAMLTGDAQGVADWVARELGIEQYFAEVLPQDKAEKVKQLQNAQVKNEQAERGRSVVGSTVVGSRRRRVVAMVGDGVNDAPALTQADIGIAIGAGTDVAIESADIILMKSDPRDVVKIIELSRATYGKMIQNLIWATGYNIIAIPLAAGMAVLLGYDLLLPPAVGALLMSGSTVVVAANAQLLRRLKL